ASGLRPGASSRRCAIPGRARHDRPEHATRLWCVHLAAPGSSRDGVVRPAGGAMTQLTTQRATGILRVFEDAGILAPADVHVALRLGALGQEDREPVLLAVALTLRALRLGSRSDARRVG